MVSFPLLMLWSAVLIAQNASFTIVSRARNSGSDWYHGIAAIFSNGIWFLSQTFIILSVTEVVRHLDWRGWIGLLVIYVVSTVTGSVLAGKVARGYLEKGKRRVGHYDEPATISDGKGLTATVEPGDMIIIGYASPLWKEFDTTVLRREAAGNYTVPAYIKEN